MVSSPYQTRPTEETVTVGLDLIEAKLSQANDIEERSQLRPDLFLGDNGRSWLVRFTGVARQDQAHGP